MDLIRITAERFPELKELQLAYKAEIGEDRPGENEFEGLKKALEQGEIPFYGCVCDNAWLPAARSARPIPPSAMTGWESLKIFIFSPVTAIAALPESSLRLLMQAARSVRSAQAVPTAMLECIAQSDFIFLWAKCLLMERNNTSSPCHRRNESQNRPCRFPAADRF